MVNTPHFLGYTRLGTEITKGAIDIREQYDFATPYKCPWKEGDPDYLKLWGDAQVGTCAALSVDGLYLHFASQYPRALPDFKDFMTKYLAQAGDFGFTFMSLLAEALFLPPDAFDRFYDKPKEGMQHRGKVSWRDKPLRCLLKYGFLDSGRKISCIG